MSTSALLFNPCSVMKMVELERSYEKLALPTNCVQNHFWIKYAQSFLSNEDGGARKKLGKISFASKQCSKSWLLSS